MRVDGALVFEPLAGAAITGNGVSTNVLDTATPRDLGGSRDPGLHAIVTVLSSFAGPGAATLNVQLQGAGDNNGVAGPWSTLIESGAIPIGELQSGMEFRLTLPPLGQTGVAPVATTFTGTGGANTITVASATGLLIGQTVVADGFVAPGTTITGITGTTITLSANTLATAGSATAILFRAQPVMPRFYRLGYVVGSGPFTGGSIMAFLTTDMQAVHAYRAGYAFPPGA